MTESAGDGESEYEQHQMPRDICREPLSVCPQDNNGMVGLGFVFVRNAPDEYLGFGKNLAPDQARAWRVHGAGDEQNVARLYARVLQARANLPCLFHGIGDDSGFTDPFSVNACLGEHLAFIRALHLRGTRKNKFCIAECDGSTRELPGVADSQQKIFARGAGQALRSRAVGNRHNHVSVSRFFLCA